MVQKFQIDEYACQCVSNAASRKVAYMVYPHVDCFTSGWLEKMSAKCGVTIVVVYVPLDRWNDDLTPWSEPPEAKGFQPFGGDAMRFYKELTTKIVPEVEKTLGLSSVAERDLVGVSLS